MVATDNEGIICTPQHACVSCGGEGVVVHQELRDQLFGSPGVYETRRCPDPQCGLAWLNPMPESSELIKLYANYYTHDDTEAPTSQAEIDVSKYRSSPTTGRLKKILGRFLPFWKLKLDSELFHLGQRAPGRILEVGCGAGYVLRVLQAAGWDTIGIDFDAGAIATARKYGIDARVDDLISSGFAAASFDGILMNNVIEHLPNPRDVFAEARRILRPGGRLIMLTPDIDSPGHKLFGADWRGLEPPRHLYLYSATSLTRFARQAGFGHVEAFAKRDDPGGRYIVAQSRLIAERAGRMPPTVADDVLALRKRKSPFATPHGEWVVLVAEA